MATRTCGEPARRLGEAAPAWDGDFAPALVGEMPRPGRHFHLTPSLTAIDCHCLGIYTVILTSLLSLSIKMSVAGLVVTHHLLEGLERAGLAVLGLPNEDRSPVAISP